MGMKICLNLQQRLGSWVLARLSKKNCALCWTAIFKRRDPSKKYSKLLASNIGYQDISNQEEQNKSYWCCQFVGCIANENWNRGLLVAKLWSYL